MIDSFHNEMNELKFNGQFWNTNLWWSFLNEWRGRVLQLIENRGRAIVHRHESDRFIAKWVIMATMGPNQHILHRHVGIDRHRHMQIGWLVDDRNRSEMVTISLYAIWFISSQSRTQKPIASFMLRQLFDWFGDGLHIEQLTHTHTYTHIRLLDRRWTFNVEVMCHNIPMWMDQRAPTRSGRSIRPIKIDEWPIGKQLNMLQDSNWLWDQTMNTIERKRVTNRSD